MQRFAWPSDGLRVALECAQIRKDSPACESERVSTRVPVWEGERGLGLTGTAFKTERMGLQSGGRTSPHENTLAALLVSPALSLLFACCMLACKSRNARA